MGLLNFLKDVSTVYRNLGVGKFALGENNRREEEFAKKNPPSLLSTALKIAPYARFFLSSNRKPQVSEEEIAKNEKFNLFVLIILLSIFVAIIFMNAFIDEQNKLARTKIETAEKNVLVEQKVETPITDFEPNKKIEVLQSPSATVLSAEEEHLKGCSEYRKQNFQLAYSFFNSAAKKNHKLAQYNLGCLFKNGEGTPQDLKMAIFWFEQAKNNGYSEAIKQIDEINIFLEDQQPKITKPRIKKKK